MKNLIIEWKSQKKSFKNIGEELECPKSTEIIESPVITPYEFTYKEKK